MSSVENGRVSARKRKSRRSAAGCPSLLRWSAAEYAADCHMVCGALSPVLHYFVVAFRRHDFYFSGGNTP